MFELLNSIVKKIKQEIKVWRLVMKDKRTPFLAKALLWIAIGYLLLPIEIIPDFIPVIGHLDDVVIVGILLVIAMNLIPKAVVDDCRIQVMYENHS